MAVSFPEITRIAYAKAVQAAFPGQVALRFRRRVAILRGCSMRFAAVGDYLRF
jgi:hypothetical protein